MTGIRLCGSLPTEGFVVYGHRLPGAAACFHIGSGAPRRATTGRRSRLWHAHAAGRTVEAVILERHDCEARARLREAELICTLRPETNRHHRHGPTPQVRRGYRKNGTRCDCAAPDCLGRESARRERERTGQREVNG